MCVCAHVRATVHIWRSGNNFQKLVLSFHHVGPYACQQAPLLLSYATGLALTHTHGTLITPEHRAMTALFKSPQVYGSLSQQPKCTETTTHLLRSHMAVPSAAWPMGSRVRIPRTPLHSPPNTSHPLLWVQEDLGIKELVAVTVLAIPLGHQFAETGGITNEAWRGSGDRDSRLALAISVQPLGWLPPFPAASRCLPHKPSPSSSD